MSEKRFLAALHRHGMMRVKTPVDFRWINLGVPHRNQWETIPDGMNRRELLAYMIAARDRALVKAEAERIADALVDPELVYRSLPRGEDR